MGDCTAQTLTGCKQEQWMVGKNQSSRVVDALGAFSPRVGGGAIAPLAANVSLSVMYG